MLPVPGASRSRRCDARGPRRARLDPRPREIVVAGEGHDALAFRRRLVEEADRERLVAAHVRHLPRLRRIGDVAVGQQHDRRHVAGGDPHRLDRAFERVGGRARGDHRQRSVGVAAVNRLVEVRLLGLGRKAGRRPAALRVDDDQRKLGHDREAERLGLERDAGTRRRGDAELAGVGSRRSPRRWPRSRPPPGRS